jgi:hypothetical protein
MFEQSRDDFGATLGVSVVQGVSAADVCMQDVFDPDTVAKFDFVHVAWASAVGFVGAWGEDGAENTMLHMKHGHVLVDYNFESFWLAGLNKFKELIAIQVVGGGDETCTVVQQPLCG